MKRNIIVNSYPLRSSGALQILRQFIAAVESYARVEDDYIVFVHPDAKIGSQASNIRFIKVYQNSIKDRLFYFNFKGLNKYLKEHEITPDMLVSLSNVDTFIDYSVPKYLYYHQSLTLYPHRWNPLLKQEFPLFTYLTYYKWVVKRSLLKSTTVVTQLQCIEDRFSRVFSHPKEKMMIVAPNIVQTESQEIYNSRVENRNSINIIFAATPVAYKNHKVLFEALDIIGKSVDTTVTLYLTGDKEEFNNKVFPEGSSVKVKYMGVIAFDELLQLYGEMDALVFPSYIESFGLPMIEAAIKGIKVVAADMDFAREVLSDYEGAEFVDPFAVEAWVEAILGLKKEERFKPLVIEKSSSWKLLLDEINKLK